MAITFGDIEASSLYQDSYPIEIGWCSHDLLSGGSILIRPLPRWYDWSEASEKCHGLNRNYLVEHGVAATQVIPILNDKLGQTALISDIPEFDIRWLNKLKVETGQKATFHISATPFEAMRVAAEERMPSTIVTDYREVRNTMARDIGVNEHRALDDCIRHALSLAAIALERLRHDHGPDTAHRLQEELVRRGRDLLVRHGRP
jgi:hypothetical protein